MSQNSQSTAKRVDVIASLESEQRLRALNVSEGFRFATEQVSVESQQLDEQKQVDLLAAHHENIKKLLKAEKPTGTPNLFVLDPEQIAMGDLGATATLQALANQQFSSNSRSAVAMLPPESGYTTAGEGAVSLLKDGILKDCGLVTLESIEDLNGWVASL